MNTLQKTLSARSFFTTLCIFLLTMAWTFAPVPPVFPANYKVEADHLVEGAKYAFESFLSDSNMAAFHDLLRQAKGIFIAPQLLKGAFIVGASGGSGVFFALDERQGVWRGPAFYRLGGASFGLQIGGQASEVVLLAMTDRGVSSLLANSIKLGADVGIAAGPIGAGVAAGSANLSADLLSFARSRGLYGGVALDGAVIAVRHALNEAYYKKKADASDILIRHEVSNPQASGLIESIRKATGKK